MQHPYFAAFRLVSTLALLGAAATTGCTIGTIGSEESDLPSASGGDTNTTTEENDNPHSNGGGTSNTNPGGDQGGGNGGGSPSSGAGASDPGGEGEGDPGGHDGPGGTNGQGVFEAPNVWTKNVAGLTKSSKSDAIIDWLDQAGGWGSGVMRIDFGIEVLEADSSTPKKEFFPTDEFYSPDCDEVAFPVPVKGAIESEDGYECTQDGDCHLIVLHKDEKKLYEMWRANITGGTFYGGCAAVWDLTKTYPENLRGEGCTSADAGGFPIAAMLFTPEEVAAGAINHAIRFILPNARIRDNVYVHPGTHSTGATSGGSNAPPYGVRLRLRKDFPMEALPSDGARVIAKALQEYGMFLSDGGTIALTGESDRFSAHKWEDLGVDAYALEAIDVTDMEVVDMGEPITWSGDCERN